MQTSITSQGEEGRNVHWIDSRDQRLDEDLVLAWLGLLESLDIVERPGYFFDDDTFHFDFFNDE